MNESEKEKRSNRLGGAFLCFLFFGAAVIGFGKRDIVLTLCGLIMGVVMAYVALRGRFPSHWWPWQRRHERELAELFPQRSEEEQARFDEECARQRAEAQNIKDYTIDGVAYPRIPLGREQTWEESVDVCGDCFVSLGQLHIPGCDMEECPKSHRQAISSPHHIAELQGPNA